ncbi:MAG: Arc family DNA binding domain-containing protein [Bacteroidia bacterium]|nr:Arc family DNA binding domain-containing protein [Bacteroidia bacterium]
MSKKKVFMLRLNQELYAALETWAFDEFRSVNGQMEWILDRALKERGRSPKKIKKNDIQKKAQS